MDNKEVLENITETKENNNKDKKRVILFVILMILILLLGFRLGSCSCHKDKGSVTIGHTVPEIDPNAGEYEKPDTQPSQGVAIPGWGSIKIPANQKNDLTVDFYNPEKNKDMYYLTFELRIPNNSAKGYEILYTSGLIEPGLHIQSIDLNRAFNAGEYNAVIHVQPYRMSDKSTTNNADLKTKLIVQ